MYKVRFNKDRTIMFLVFASEYEAEQYFYKYSLEGCCYFACYDGFLNALEFKLKPMIED